MTKKEREAHFISYINPNNLHEYITKCSNCGCGLSNVAYYCPICGVKINKRVVHARDDRIIIYPSWIPVSKRLPEESQKVLVTDKFDVVTTAMYFRQSPFWREMVVAWMPLPEPYRESEE